MRSFEKAMMQMAIEMLVAEDDWKRMMELAHRRFAEDMYDRAIEAAPKAWAAKDLEPKPKVEIERITRANASTWSPGHVIGYKPALELPRAQDSGECHLRGFIVGKRR